jgi:prepilin signal peptidase PulO-like enzyme (type II secretory pathway)
MHKLLEKLKEEFFAALPPTIFFFVMLHIVSVVRVLMAKGTTFQPMSTISITVAALILGKAVLIADHLPAINRYPEEPLIYNVAWKTVIYLVLAGVIHYLERLFDFSRQAGGIVAGNEKLLAEIVWPHFWAIQLWLVVLIFVYCALRELIRVIGRHRVAQVFFGSPTMRAPARH